MADTTREYDPSLGRQLREIREEAGFTQEQLGQLLGISRVQISRIEKGSRSTGFAMVRKWYRACGYELDAVQVGDPETSMKVIEALAELPPEYVDEVTTIILAWPRFNDRTRARILGIAEGLDLNS